MSNYIFPPIVDTYQKAFVIGGDEIWVTESHNAVKRSAIKIKYRAPATGENAGNIEISIRNQYNNLSIAKNGDSELTPVQIDGPTDKDPYTSIYLLQNEVNIGLNQWYRVQLRYRVENPQNNTTSYSEWSTVTLIKAISKPSVIL